MFCGGVYRLEAADVGGGDGMAFLMRYSQGFWASEMGMS